LLVVLAVDIPQQGGKVLEKRHCNWAASQERSRFAASQDLAFDQQFTLFDGEAGRFEEFADGGLFADFEDAGDAGAVFAGADHVGGGAAAEEQAEGIDDQRLAATGFAGEEVEAGVEADAEAVNHGIVFDYEFEEH